MKKSTHLLVTRYYQAINGLDWQKVSLLLAPDVLYESNQAAALVGQTEVLSFLKHWYERYFQEISDVEIFVSDEGSRAAAEFMIIGSPIDGQPGFTYELRGGAFFDIEHGKISRLTDYYHPDEWNTQLTWCRQR